MTRITGRLFRRVLILTVLPIFAFVGLAKLDQAQAGGNRYGVHPVASSLAPGDIVLWASEASVRIGGWPIASDATAAGGERLSNPDAGVPKIIDPLVSPPNYFEMTFSAQAATGYRLWIRGKAQGDSPYNDSVFAQFAGSVDAGGSAVFRIGTSSATAINLEDGLGVGLSAWGWQDNGWGPGAP